MIEFKAECGHTIRAKDQDAGNLVRCSYCGKTSSVPEQTGDALEFLFEEEVERAVEEGAASANKARRRPRRPKRKAKRGDFNPFAFCLKLGYAAALIIILYLGVIEVILPAFETARSGESGIDDPAVSPGAIRKPLPGAQPATPNRGLNLPPLDGRPGLYVASTPGTTRIHYALAEKLGNVSGRISGNSECKTAVSGSKITNAPEGIYVVEVSIPLNSPELRGYPEWNTFRSKMFDGSDDRVDEAKRYFLPDEADEIYVYDDEIDGQPHLVRQYRNVRISPGRWTQIRPLFLPRVYDDQNGGFALDRVIRYLPKGKTYKFDRTIVSDDLDVYRIPPKDWQFAMDALERVGAIPYKMPDGTVLLLEIGIEDSLLRKRNIEDLNPFP